MQNLARALTIAGNMLNKKSVVFRTKEGKRHYAFNLTTPPRIFSMFTAAFSLFSPKYVANDFSTLTNLCLLMYEGSSCATFYIWDR